MELKWTNPDLFIFSPGKFGKGKLLVITHKPKALYAQQAENRKTVRDIPGRLVLSRRKLNFN